MYLIFAGYKMCIYAFDCVLLYVHTHQSMTKIFTFLACTFLPALLVAQAPVSNDTKWPNTLKSIPVVDFKAGAVVPGELLVLLERNEDAADVANLLGERGFPVLSKTMLAKSMHVWKFSITPQADGDLALKNLRQLPGVKLAQFNHLVSERVTVPDDTNFSQMWGLDNTGQNGGTPDADIDAPEAWDMTTGGLTSQGDTIVVAVVDGGFSLAHQDLNFWKNWADDPTNSIDDDNNGYIDDRNGWNAYNNNSTMGSSSHGTHVSGTVGARGNNSLGVVGVNWGLQVMPIMGSSGDEATVIIAYTYALDARRRYNQTNGTQGAFVVSTNASFGVDLGQPANYPIWCAMYDSLGAQGILSAAATANQNWDIDQQGDIPTACSSNYMIAVTNTTRNDVKTTSAGYGITTIDLGAPGTSINSTYPNNAYATISGTSMATPHVAGAIALMYAAACPQLITDYKTNPAAVALTMRQYLLAGVDTLAALSSQCATGGRLNLNGALLQVQTYNCTTLVVNEALNQANVLSLQNVFPNPANQWLNITFEAPGVTQVDLVLYDVLGQEVMRIRHASNGGINTQKLDVSGLSGGVYVLRVESEGKVSGGQRVVVK
jgi:subtilisin family serine protease